MRDTRSCRPADGDGIARDVRIGHGSESTVFFVTYVDELYASVSAQRVDRRIESITHDAVTSAHPSGRKQFPHRVGNMLAHISHPLLVRIRRSAFRRRCAACEPAQQITSRKAQEQREENRGDVIA
jgi:hypothetical protein